MSGGRGKEMAAASIPAQLWGITAGASAHPHVPRQTELGCPLFHNASPPCSPPCQGFHPLCCRCSGAPSHCRVPLCSGGFQMPRPPCAVVPVVVSMDFWLSWSSP